MSGLGRDDGRHLSARDEDGSRALLAMVISMALSIVVWAAIAVLVGRWM